MHANLFMNATTSPPASTPLSLSIYTDPTGFETLRTEWDQLLRRSAFNSIFLAWDWQRTWWESLGVGELLLLAWRNGEDLVGIAPLYHVCDERGCRLHLVGCTEVADYLDLIIARGWEEEVYAGFLHFLTSVDAPRWDVISLCNLYEPSPTYRLLPPLAQSFGLQATVEQEDVAPYLTLPPTFDEYLASLTKKQRHEIRRKRRKLEREAANWRWFQIRGEEELDVWVERFIQLHRLASADKEDFMTAQMAAFFHRIAHTAARLGWLSLAFIEINGELASAMFDFDYDGRIWVYNSGYNPAIYGHLSPGIALTSHLIEEAIISGHHTFDFLQGDEVYKYRFGATDAKVMNTILKR